LGGWGGGGGAGLAGEERANLHPGIGGACKAEISRGRLRVGAASGFRLAGSRKYSAKLRGRG